MDVLTTHAPGIMFLSLIVALVLWMVGSMIVSASKWLFKPRFPYAVRWVTTQNTDGTPRKHSKWHWVINKHTTLCDLGVATGKVARQHEIEYDPEEITCKLCLKEKS